MYIHPRIKEIAEVEEIGPISTKASASGTTEISAKAKINGQTYIIRLYREADLPTSEAGAALNKEIEKIILMTTRYMHAGMHSIEFNVDKPNVALRKVKDRTREAKAKLYDYDFDSQKKKAEKKKKVGQDHKIDILAGKAMVAKASARLTRIEKASRIWKIMEATRPKTPESAEAAKPAAPRVVTEPEPTLRVNKPRASATSARVVVETPSRPGTDLAHEIDLLDEAINRPKTPDELSDIIGELEAESAARTSRTHISEQTIILLQEQLKHAQEATTDSHHALIETQTKVAELERRIQQLENERNSHQPRTRSDSTVLNLQIATLREEKTNLENENQRLMEAASRSLDTHGDLVGKIQHLSLLMEVEKEKTIDALHQKEAELAHAKREADESRSMVLSFEQLLDSVVSKSKENEAEINQLIGQLESKERALEALSTHSNEAGHSQTQLKAELNRLNEAKAQLEAENSAIHEQVTQINHTLEQLQTKTQVAERSATDAEEQTLQLQEANSKLLKQNENLRALLEKQKTEFRGELETLKGVETQNQKQMQQLADLRSQLDALKTQLTHVKETESSPKVDENQVKRLQERLASIKEERESLKTQMKQLEDENYSIQKTRKEQRKELEKLKSEHEQLQSDQNDMSASYDELHTKQIESQKAFTKTQKEKKKLEKELSQLNEEYNEIKQENTKLHEERVRLQPELRKKLHEESQEKIKVQEQQIAELTNQLEELQLLVEIPEEEIIELQRKADLLDKMMGFFKENKTATEELSNYLSSPEASEDES